MALIKNIQWTVTRQYVIEFPTRINEKRKDCWTYSDHTQLDFIECLTSFELSHYSVLQFYHNKKPCEMSLVPLHPDYSNKTIKAVLLTSVKVLKSIYCSILRKHIKRTKQNISQVHSTKG